MFIAELFNGSPVAPHAQETMYVEAAQPQLVVLYPGRFQPFHLGHGDVFASLQSKYGRDNVYIATSNKTEPPKSPFNFSDKTVFMTAAGVPVDRILEVASPYKLPPQFDPATTIFVVAVGAPDADRLKPGAYKKDGQPGYFQNFKGVDKCQTADKHGYVIIASERKKLITINGKQYDVSHGTESRNLWNSVRKDPKARAEFVTQMYGRNDPEVAHILDKIPLSEDSNMPVAVDSTSPIHGTVNEHIVKHGSKYRLVSKHGNKNLGTYDTKAGAEKRERQVQYFKHLGEEAEVVDAWGYIYNNRDQRVVWSKKFPNEEAAKRWADKNNATLMGCKAIPNKISEDAAGVGVVKNSKDPRYVMATMGDQNDVDASTLPKMMRAYGLTGRKLPKGSK